ncbi:hypothetical protein BD560DRAFT_410815, partial [Blakeslea trispora]
MGCICFKASLPFRLLLTGNSLGHKKVKENLPLTVLFFLYNTISSILICMIFLLRIENETVFFFFVQLSQTWLSFFFTLFMLIDFKYYRKKHLSIIMQVHICFQHN